MQLELILGDITQPHNVEAIVNAANRTLLGGGGVDGAIHRAAGPKLLEECRTLGGCETGEARLTRAYDLPCSWVIHTVGPVYKDGKHGEPALLAACYRNSLTIAHEKGIRRLAFPSVSTGVYGYPVSDAARVALTAIRDTVADWPDAFDYLAFVLFDRQTLAAYQAAAEELGML